MRHTWFNPVHLWYIRLMAPHYTHGPSLHSWPLPLPGFLKSHSSHEKTKTVDLGSALNLMSMLVAVPSTVIIKATGGTAGWDAFKAVRDGGVPDVPDDA